MAAQTVALRRPARDYRRLARTVFRRLFIYPLLIALSAVFLVPFFWMVSTAFKEPRLIYQRDPIWIPLEPTLRNFREALGLLHPGFLQLLLNSATITGLSVLGMVLSSSLVGFAFATLPARGKKFLFTLVLSTLMIPHFVLLIPQFVFFVRLGWKDTWLPLILPSFLASPFYVFMFRQFFASIPRDLLDSAELDGCTPLGLYWRLALPLSKPAIATAAVFTFLWSWNDLVNPLIYLSDYQKYTLTLGLAGFGSAMMSSQSATLQHFMPLSLLALLPVLLIFFLGLRYFVQGIVTTGMKG